MWEEHGYISVRDGGGSGMAQCCSIPQKGVSFSSFALKHSNFEVSSGVFSHPPICLTHNLSFMSVSLYVERMELWMAGRMPKGSGCNNRYQTLGPIGLRSSRERMTSDPCTLVGQLSLSLPPRSLLGLHLLSSSLLSSPAPFIR